MIENLIDTTENCRFCLMCRHVEPVGLITHLETLTPHGIALLVSSQRRGLIDWNPESIDVLYSEPDSGNCRAHCVTSQPLPAAIAAVRAEVVADGRAPAGAISAHELLQRWSNPYNEQEPKPVNDQGPVALFIGDESAHLEPDTIPAIQKLLSACGLNPILIGYGRNNGLLASSLGYPETAHRLIQDTLDEMQTTGAQTMFVLSPGDKFAFGQMADERLGISWPAGLELVDVMDYLVAQNGAGQLNFRPYQTPLPYAYVDPTHTVRVPGRYQVVRQLVSSLLEEPGIELFWSRERAHPVGSTHLQFTHPDLADQLTRTRLQDGQQRGAKLLISDDPGTLYQLRRFSGEYGLEVENLYKLLADHLL